MGTRGLAARCNAGADITKAAPDGNNDNGRRLVLHLGQMRRLDKLQEKDIRDERRLVALRT